MLHNILRLIDQHPRRVAFLLLSLLLLFMNLNRSDFVFYHDSLGYWTHANDFIKGGAFSFPNFDFPVRGYLFPFIIFIITSISSRMGISGYVGYEVIASLVYSVTLTIVIPGLVYRLSGRKPLFFQILVFSLLSVYFWRGLFFYPLTDLPALCFILIGVYIVVRFSNHWWAMLLAGMLWGGSTILRPSYQIILLPLLIWAFYYFYHAQIHRRLYNLTLRFLALMTGLILVFTPQGIINWKNYGIISPIVQTQLFFNGADLFSLQLGWGIYLQKYETNVGDSYPSASVMFLDDHGENMLIYSGLKSVPYTKSHQIGPDKLIPFSTYLRLLARYPLDFIALYGRHFFNGLDVVYNTVYVPNVYAGSILFRFINYTIWFVVLIYLGYNVSKRKIKYLNSRLVLVLILVLPALLTIPTVVEVRFFLPLHLLAYALVAFGVLPDFLALNRLQMRLVVFRYLFWYGCFLILCFMLSANTYMGLENGPYILTNFSR